MTAGGLKRFLRDGVRAAVSSLFVGLARAVTGVRPIWLGTLPTARPRIYFANHASHGDFILFSACLPPDLRPRMRAAAAADYWGKTRLRRFLAEDMMSAVLISRSLGDRTHDPIAEMAGVLDDGCSLLVFPEGTRNMTDQPLLPFRSGIYNLAIARPQVELVPCWIENMSRVMPKGEFLPVPLLCRVIFGEPIRLAEGEERHAFVGRARDALLALHSFTPGDQS